MDSVLSLNFFRQLLREDYFSADDLVLYERYLDQIESNKVEEPNIAFEATKSLCEALLRHILANPKIKVEFSSILSEKTPSTYKLFKATCGALAESNLIDLEILGLGQKFFNDMSEIRNSVGIISHGKDLRDTSNLKKSTIELAISTSIHFLTILVEAYSALIDKQEVKYEEYDAFNEYLDELYEINDISYSKALYDQDIVAYKEQLDEYNEAMEIN